jgi:hypothetical protein
MAADEDDRWSVETVVEVLELDCDSLQGARGASRLADYLLLFCLACLLTRFIQVALFEGLFQGQ